MHIVPTLVHISAFEVPTQNRKHTGLLSHPLALELLTMKQHKRRQLRQLYVAPVTVT